MADVLTLADFRAELIRVACRRCDRRGQNRQTTLVALYGVEAPPPDVLAAIRTSCLPCSNAPKSTIVSANLEAIAQILIFAQQ